MAGDRNSGEWEDRVEWQLDQIRQAVMAVAVVVLLAALGVLVLALGASG